MTAWIIRILPNLRRRDVNSDLADPDRLHKRMMMLIPDGLGEQARARAGVLFRVEDTRQGVQLLAQSQVKPDLERLPDGYGEIAVRELDGLLRRLASGQPVHYRIAANPSKRLSRSAGKDEGKVVALHGPAAEEWWAARSAANGLAVTTVTSRSLMDIRARHVVRHAVVQFDGHGTVSDPHALRAAVLNGIGRGKTYGCGLLSLAPAAAW
ncbi:type I-E CRISPR-associated protein Cas6/Cse3/CasE [Acrocarpospora phusangensis]|uniref:Type I-E CRISPR-associated protein Cas6/Cse3/CasE n=1 Tax=Acrocarpospora phusangensis TaxID=1070424 RepID=A0A919QIU6_9ACTN|nr:type I-E CRISPR-associated protein Cas6/Cse3/CasE [Acrocarpospora phusangensis]GIH29588.1 type I-E CRISPR-associated protein Cas6/Cse3/CasE [Acrocarpospora phusangensis]